MNITYIYQYFGTSNGQWSTRVYEFARRWVALGHSVTVITSPYDKSDIKPLGFVSNQDIEGIDLIVIDSGDSNRFSKAIRTIYALRFAFIAIYYALKLRSDVVISSSGPITVAIPALATKFLRKTTFIFEVRDLWPLGGIVMGKIRNPFIKAVLLWFERYIYTKADCIITCSKGQRDNICKRLGFSEKLHVIPNASDIELFGVFKDLSVGQRSLIGNNPYVLHLGSLGFIHNCEYLIEVARYIPNIPMVFIGDGAERDRLIQLAELYQLSNVYFLGQMPKKETVAWMSNCELSLFTTLDNIIQDTSSPNKVFDSFASGKPIIQTTRGWIHDLIIRENCGFNADPSNPQDFAIKILHYFNLTQEEKVKISNSAKRLASTQFNRNKLSKKFIDLIMDVNTRKL